MNLAEKIAPEFLLGGGEMGELIRTMDWSQSSLGDLVKWPPSLRAAVSICLSSRFPSLIMWRNEFIELYNDAYRELMGAKHPKALGARAVDVWPEIWDFIGPLLRGVFENGVATWSEDQQLVIERNGYPEECYFTFSYSPIRDESGSIGGVFCTVIETTKRVLSERHLSKQINNLFTQAPVAICILRGKNYVIEMINVSMAEMWDRKQEDVLNKPAFDVLTELMDQGFKELLDNVYINGERFVAEEMPINLVRNGKIENAFVKFIYEPLREEDGTITGVMALAHEITEQVMARQKIEESEAFNRTVLESSPDCIKILDAEGRLIFMNSNGLCNMEITDFSQIKNEFWWNLWGEDNRPLIKNAVTKALNGQTAYFQALGITLKGNTKWWDVKVSPVLEKDNTKKISHIISSSRDITEQKQAAIKLEESEYRYHNMIHTSTSLILILKGENLIIELANEAMLQSMGKGKDITGKPLLSIMPELIEQGLDDLLHQVYITGQPCSGFEFPVNIMRNGKMELTYYTYVNQAQRNLNGDVSGVSVIAIEVTSQASYNLKIKESEERFRSLADQIPMFTFIVDPTVNASVSYWNKTWLNYTGQTFEEALGTAWSEIIHPDDVPHIMDIYVTAFEKQKPYFLPAIRIKRFDGEYRWHMIKSNPRFMPNGEFMGYIGIGFDIHESKLAQDLLKESETQFRLITNLMPGKITNTDAAGNVVYYNQAWIDYTGLNFEELINGGWEKMIHPDELAGLKLQWQHSLQTENDFDIELRILNKEGEYKWHNGRIAKVKDDNGKIKMWISVTTEIQKIKDEEQRKDNFIKMVSHELKTPVTSIKGYVQLLLNQVKEEEDEEALLISLPVKPFLVRIEKLVLRLTKLITEILDMSRIEADRLELKSELFSLNTLLAETVEDIRHTNPMHTIEIYDDFSCKVYADKGRIEQVIINLVTNAIKYSTGADKIVIRIFKASDTQIGVSVKDYEIGIDQKEHEKIFERFYRVAGKNEDNYPGFGIGLYIVKDILLRHGGSINVSSEKGKGAIFTFLLPCT